MANRLTSAQTEPVLAPRCKTYQVYMVYKCSAVAEMADRLATIDIGRKWGCVPFGGASTHVAWADAYLHTRWHLDPCSRLAIIDMGRKRGAVLLWGWGAGSPSNIMCPAHGRRPTSTPSFILIHVWPQYTNVTDRQTDRQTGHTENGPIA